VKSFHSQRSVNGQTNRQTALINTRDQRTSIEQILNIKVQ